MFYTYVASVLSGCCVCFAMVSSVSSVFFYVASVASGCFKSTSGVAHIAIAMHACFKWFIYFRRMLQVFHLDV